MVMSEYRKNILTMITGKSLAQVITLASSVIITRLFEPGDYGIAALIMAAITLVSVLTTLRYNQAIVLPKLDCHAVLITKVCLILTFIVTLLCILLVSIFYDDISHYFELEAEDAFVISLFPTIVFINGIYEITSGWMVRSKCFWAFSISNILSSTLSAAFKIISCLFYKSSPALLVIGNVLGTLSAGLFLLRSINRDFFDNYKTINMSRAFLIAKNYYEFPLYSLPNALFNKSGKILPIFILGFYFQSSVVGFFALAYTMVKAVVGVIAESVRKVYIQKASRMIIEGKYQNLLKLYVKTTFLTGAIAAVPVMVLSAYGGDIFSIIFGNDWISAGVYAELLAPWLFCWLTSSASIGTFVAFRKQYSLFIIQTSIITARIISLLLGAEYGDVNIAIFAFSIASAIGGVMLIVYAYFIIRNAGK